MRVTSLLLAASLLAPAAASAETGPRWLMTSAELRAAPEDPEPAGEILVASPVTVVGPERNGRVEVILTGWTDREGRALYATASPAVELARVEPGLLTRREDAAPEGWTRADLRGWLDPSMLTGDAQALWHKAFADYRAHCTRCHPRRAPEKYSVEEWAEYFRIMGPRTRLPRDEQLLIRAYLQRHASDAAELESVLPPGDLPR